MITSIKFENKLTMIAQMCNDSKFQVLEFDELKGGGDIATVSAVDTMNKSGMRLRQVRIILQDSAVKLEQGALSYMKGSIDSKSAGSRAVNFGKRFLNGKLGNDNLIDKITYEGNGEIFLEPSFGYFVLIELEDEEIIVEDGLFFACEDVIEVKSVTNGVKYETSYSGSGIVVLELPVPEEEVFKCKLYKDTLKVDGDFAVLRGKNIAHSIIGEENINVYSGIGDVWILPTKEIYEDLRINNLYEQEE
jgi:uncharacterized protein (AIM24 family)